METEDINVHLENGICTSEGTFQNRDGLTIFTRKWSAKSETPRALIFVAHGFGEHSGRYSDFLVPGLVEEGFLVFGHDHVGHGKSDGERAQIDTCDIYVRDVLDHIDKVTPDYPGIPWFLFGHSMGGMIAILTAMERPSFFTGVILSAPALTIERDTYFMRFLARLFVMIWPSMEISPPLDTSMLSRDTEKVKDYESDPLVWHGRIKVGIGLAVIDSIDAIREKTSEIEWPFLLLQGTADAIIRAEGAVDFEKEANSKDKTIKLYEGFYHELLNEPLGDAEVVLNDIRQWLRERLPAD